MSVRKVYRTSTEYLAVSITADETLDTQPVEISVDNQVTWLGATWVGSPGLTRSARILLSPSAPSNMPPAGERLIFVRLTDSPEVPVFSTTNTVKFI